MWSREDNIFQWFCPLYPKNRIWMQSGAPCIYDVSIIRILWLTKEALYRDASWESPCTGGSALYLFFGMGIAFWSNIVLLVTGQYSLTKIFSTKCVHIRRQSVRTQPCTAGHHCHSFHLWKLAASLSRCPGRCQHNNFQLSLASS
jgi:hypothetical protein